MKNCGICVDGRYFYCETDKRTYGGWHPKAISSFVYGGVFRSDKIINLENVEFENVGYVDFNTDEPGWDGQVHEHEDGDTSDGTLEFYEEDLEEFKSKLEKKTNAILKYIESELKVYYGELRFNGNPMGVEVIKCICFRGEKVEFY